MVQRFLGDGSNPGYGILVTSSGNIFEGNYIGTDITGSVALGNNDDGIRIVDAAQNVIGGTLAAARNVISGNENKAIHIRGASGGSTLSFENQILGNHIGTDVTGTLCVGNGQGVVVRGPDNTIGGSVSAARNVISCNGGGAAGGDGSNGVNISNPEATGNMILGNFIGVDASGTVGLGSQWRGIWLWNYSSASIVGGTAPGARNVISGNEKGIYMVLGTSMNTVLGNYIGPDVSGTEFVGNDTNGVEIEDVANNVVGGLAEGAGNVLSGNRHGVMVQGALATGNQILGNRIGVDVTGTESLPNAWCGVRFREGASGNTLGGTSPEARNIISGNSDCGVEMILGSTMNDVLGNYVGTNATGTAVLGNQGPGIRIEGPQNTIGGVAEGAGNLISGNGLAGVSIRSSEATDNQVMGNSIGTDVTGRAVLGNGLAGVEIFNANDNTIGGTVVGAGNLIAGNTTDGVAVFGDASPNGNAIVGNSLFDNGLLGVDLNAPDGVTPNDTGDADAGPNRLQNFPSLTSADATPAGVTILGGLNSVRSLSYRVEFFTNTTCDASGYGEAERFLGFTNVNTDISGNGSFNVVLSSPVSDGDFITSTATSALGDTSELCDCVAAVCQSLVTFGETITALDANTWGWSVPQDVRFTKGDLVEVSDYAVTDEGESFSTTSLDMSMDSPGPGHGLYYLVRPLGCGSWQTGPGTQPARDAALP